MEDCQNYSEKIHLESSSNIGFSPRSDLVWHSDQSSIPYIDQKAAALQEELEVYREQVKKLQSDLQVSKETQLEQLQEELKTAHKKLMIQF
ncbi:unnamed protein product [Blepharisma stoltei]|uniref:Uncharacterized protein n=1 Tax=Blepharisma stoltei TaxID=1481888 RepID=A0AAU9IS10_9CILI|nr:unnamed protein product [Blepharisma stoltei]